MKPIHHPLPDLPTSQELLCALIREDLRSHRFFTGLRKLGIDDVYHQADLSSLILTYARLHPDNETVSEFYFNLRDKHIEKLSPQRSELVKAAARLYEELMAFKAQYEA